MKTTNLLALGLMCTSLNTLAAQYFIAPNGNDSNDGTTVTTALQTWSKAFETMSNGDSLTVLPGVWSEESNYCSTSSTQPCYEGAGATMELNCADAQYGNLQNVTVTASQERQSVIRADGFAAIWLYSCSGWTVEGLQVRSKDVNNSGPQVMSVVQIQNSNDITLKKLLISNNNRYFNTHLLSVLSSNDVLVEGSELYDFHRHGIHVNSSSHHVTTRGNFINARMYEDLPAPAKQSGNGLMGDYCIDFDQSNDNISENDIGVSCMGIVASGSRNSMLGSIVLDSDFGFRSFASCSGAYCNVATNYPQDNLLQDVLAIRPNVIGIECDASECTVNNATVVDSKIWNVAIRDRKTTPGFDTIASLNNSIALNTTVLTQNNSAGFLIGAQETVQATDLFAFANNTSTEYMQGQSNFSGFGGTNVSGTWHEVDPQVTCLLDLDEANSPVKDHTTASVGADLRYKYIDGVKTTDKLFTATGDFSYCGAVIDGVNGGDNTLYMHSCLGVKEQLGLGTNGACAAQGI